MKYSVYIDREDLYKTEDNERNNFIKSVLENIGLDVGDIWPEDNIFTPNDKIKLFEYLKKFKIEIIKEGRNYKIYVEDDLIAEWLTPHTILKKDPSARTISKSLFYEMQFECFSLFDDEEKE